MRSSQMLLALVVIAGGAVTAYSILSSKGDTMTAPAARAENAPRMVDPGPLVTGAVSFDDGGIEHTHSFARQGENTFGPDGFTVTASAIDRAYPYINIRVRGVDLATATYPLTIEPSAGSANSVNPVVYYSVATESVAGTAAVVIESFSDGNIVGHIPRVDFVSRSAETSRFDNLRFSMKLQQSGTDK